MAINGIDFAFYWWVAAFIIGDYWQIYWKDFFGDEEETNIYSEGKR